MFKKFISWNWEKEFEFFATKHARDFKLLFILFSINLVIYGQKVFFLSLSIDDYGRFNSAGDEQASWLGRWMAGIVNQHVFTGPTHILPYFNGLIGIFCFTVAGFLTAKIFKRTKTIEIFIVTLLASATPMLADNLYFSTNISAWIAISLAVWAMFIFDRTTSYINKAFAIALLTISIGCYQANLQIVLAIVLVKIIISIVESSDNNDLKKIFLNFCNYAGFIILAFVLSITINFIYIKIYNLQAIDRFESALKANDLSIYLSRFTSMFYIKFGLRFFKPELINMYKIMGLASLAGSILMIVRGRQQKNIKTLLIVIITALFLYIPIVNNLPNLLGAIIALRAHYSIGWFMAGFFVIQAIAFKNTLKLVSTVISLAIIVISAFYINIFFDSAHRQTSADIIRASQIVNRIRADANFTSEPIQLKVVGLNPRFSVKPWDSDEQAFNSTSSRYRIFEIFTDLNFQEMQDDDFEKMQLNLINKGNLLERYPGKNSIIVDANKVILFLDPSEINHDILMNRISGIKAASHNYYDVYRTKNELIYLKSPCERTDLASPFYLHIYPRKPTVFKDNMDYYDRSFLPDTVVKNQTCIINQELPGFDILSVSTGQYDNVYNPADKKPYVIYWESVIEFN
jgi:hypothetical protein